MNHTKYYTTCRLCELDNIRKKGGIDCNIVEPAWLYALNKKTGEITETEGTYWKSGKRSYFLVKGTDDFYESLPDEGIVRSGNRVWLSKQDKGRAACIFSDHFRGKISKLVEETDRLTDIAGRIHN